MIRDSDLAALADACKLGDQRALDELAPRIGLALRTDVLHELVRQAAGRVAAHEVATVAVAASAHEHGIAWDTLGYRRWVCVAVRDGERVVVGLRALPDPRSTPATVWPSLRPWFKQLARNRERASAWARIEADDRASFAVRAVGDGGDDRASEAELIAQIVDRPEDVALRLVLADLLMEREDPRGELIRLAAELATAEPPERAPINARVRELEDRHRRQLAGEIVDLASDYKLAGGFVDSVTMPAATFRKHGERLFRSQPIRALRPKPCNNAALVTLAKSPHLALVRCLELVNTAPRSVTTLAALADAQLDRLEQLELHDLRLVGDDQEAALASLVAPRLRALVLRQTVVGAYALRGLGVNRAICNQLARLAMTGWVPPEGREPEATAIVDDVFGWLALPNLVSLELERAWFASDARIATLIARSPRLERVEVDSAGPLTYAAAAQCRDLRSLTIRRSVPIETFEALVALPALAALTIWHGVEPAGPIARLLLALPASHPLRMVHYAGDYFDALKARFGGGPGVPFAT